LKKVLITGINGFVGSHLAELVLEKGYMPYGITDDKSQVDNIRHIMKMLRIFQINLLDYEKLLLLLKKIKPDIIFHLAGVKKGRLKDQILINAIGTENLLRSVIKARLDPRILVSGSSAQYGLYYGEKKITEKDEFRPVSDYGVGKCVQDLICMKYLNELKIIRARAFNHIGPREPNSLVASNIARQIAVIETKNGTGKVYLSGNNGIRDFVDVRDVVRAYWLLIRKGRIGEAYNVCSGSGCSIKNIIQTFRGLTDCHFTVAGLYDRHPHHKDIQLGDPTKIREELGWRRSYSLMRSIKDLLHYWRHKNEKDRIYEKND